MPAGTASDILGWAGYVWGDSSLAGTRVAAAAVQHILWEAALGSLPGEHHANHNHPDQCLL